MNLSLRHYEKKMNEKHKKQGGPCGKKKRTRKKRKASGTTVIPERELKRARYEMEPK